MQGLTTAVRPLDCSLMEPAQAKRGEAAVRQQERGLVHCRRLGRQRVMQLGRLLVRTLAVQVLSCLGWEPDQALPQGLAHSAQVPLLVPSLESSLGLTQG